MRRVSINETLYFLNTVRVYVTYMPLDGPYPIAQISTNFGAYLVSLSEWNGNIKYGTVIL